MSDANPWARGVQRREARGVPRHGARCVGRGAGLVALALVAGLVLAASPASAHEWRAEGARHEVSLGPLEPAEPRALAARVALAPPAPGRPEAASFDGVLTNLPEDPRATYPSPTEACEAPSCRELQVEVPEGARSLYATIRWTQPGYYLVLYAVSPSEEVVGETDVSDSYDKEIGNERTIPRAQFTLADPEPGTWAFRARAVFASDTAFTGTVAVSAEPPLELPRMGVREMADHYATQQVQVNVVSVGRTPTPEQVARMRDQLPGQYRASVLLKEFPDCPDPSDCAAGRNWQVGHYSGTRQPAKGSRAEGAVPYFEPLKFTYDYRFLQASEAYTADLFAYMASITKKDQPFAPLSGTRPGQGVFLPRYDAERGKFRGPDAQVANPAVGDKIDPWLVEDWIFANRGNPAYRFKDLETGESVDGRFVNPDPGAYYDPFYTASGRKDLDRMPQGPATTMTYFVLDTFTSSLAREHFRPEAYHAFDVSGRFTDPDTGEPDGPDYMRMWGGRYRFFLLDLGAMPNSYESVDAPFFNRVPTDSATPPDGDPPIWEMENNPAWAPGDETLADKVARDVRLAIFNRFTAPFLYRPVPADVYFVANNNWSDYFSRPAPEGGGGVSYSDLTKLYDVGWVEKNLASVLPGATFVTERSDPRVRTFRYLGCPSSRAGTTVRVAGAPAVLVPDPACASPDKFQDGLEEAKSQGDDVVGAGNTGTAVSAAVIRRFVEQHRDEIAPLRPDQLTVVTLSVVFPGVMTWDLPAIVGGVAFSTPNKEAWGVLQNVNDRFKTPKATDCSRSLPVAPGCNGVPGPPTTAGFSYTVLHETSHFFGLLHPHDSVVVDKDVNGEWNHYGQWTVAAGSFSQAPTTYAGSFAPYSVLDQDVIQRGHVAEYLRMAQDWVADAWLEDALAGRGEPSAATARKQSEMERWRATVKQRFACGDYLHAEYAARNAYLASQGVYGPVVAPRQLKAGERVLFDVEAQTAYVHGGRIAGCPGAVRTGSQADLPRAKRGAAAPSTLAPVPVTAPGGDEPALATRPAGSSRPRPATEGMLALALLAATTAGAFRSWGRRHEGATGRR